MNRFYIVGLLIISTIWSNARMLDHLLGYKMFHIFGLPREFRFVEVAFVGLFFLIAYARFNSETGEKRFEHLRMPGLLITIGLLSGILNGVGILDIFQGLYLFLSPLMVYFTARWLKFGKRELRTIQFAVLTIFILNIPAWFYQVVNYFIFDGNGDNVNGFFSDSHLYANIHYCIVIFAIAAFVIRHDFKMLILSAVVFFMAFMSLNEKSLLFIMPIILFLFIAKKTNANKKSKLIAVLLVVLLLTGAYSIGQNVLQQSETELRTSVITERQLTDLGTVLAYIQLPDVFADVPHALVYGVGVGNYGSSIAIRRNIEGTSSELSKRFVGDLELAGSVGAFAWRTNYFIGMLVEYGIIFTVIIFLFYLSIVRHSMRTLSKVNDKNLKIWNLTIVGSLILIIMTAFVSNISNFDEGILAYPIMLAAAAVHNEREEWEVTKTME